MATPRDSSQRGYAKRPGGSSTRKHATEVLGKFHLHGKHSGPLMKHNALVRESVCLKGVNEGGRVEVLLRNFKTSCSYISY